MSCCIVHHVQTFVLVVKCIRHYRGNIEHTLVSAPVPQFQLILIYVSIFVLCHCVYCPRRLSRSIPNQRRRLFKCLYTYLNETRGQVEYQKGPIPCNWGAWCTQKSTGKTGDEQHTYARVYPDGVPRLRGAIRGVTGTDAGRFLQ